MRDLTQQTGERRKSPYPRSPLRYPGGKSRAVQQLLKFFPGIPRTVASPFFGGASVELALAAAGWQVNGYDADPRLVAFWRQLLTEPHALADEVRKYFPLSRENFQQLQTTQQGSDLDVAARYFAINRASFSGAGYSGGYSGQRFTQSCIDRLRNFAVENLRVEQGDFRDTIPLHPDSLVFADPPYRSAKKLYGRRGDLHDGFGHRELRELLGNRSSWILCYDDCVQVREAYKGYAIHSVHWKYGMSGDKVSREVVILSNDLHPPTPAIS